jgi:predicted exporter
MCFVSTLICYIAFFFTPFTILKQFAVFSITGLSSSFLTAYCIYPLLSMHSEEKRSLKFIDSKFFIRLKNYSMPPVFRFISITVIIVLAIIIISIKGFKIDNDIRSFYTMSPSMMASEIKAAMVMDHGSAPWYFIVSGSSPDETLQHEEILIQKLEEEVSKGNLRSFLGTSVFVPSVKTQRETYEVMKTLLPLASSQYEHLGFPPEYAEIYYEEFAAGMNYCLPEDAPRETGVFNLWIGKSGDHYYSCVMLLHPKNDEDIFLSIAGELGFVHLINKAKDISNDLDTLTRTIMLFFAVAFIVVSILVFFVFSLKDSLKICTFPVFLFLSAIAALTIRNIPLGFFSIAAIILIFGLGLDYIFYITGAKNKSNKHLASFAVFLSFFTTLLSFGALTFSGFMPVHTFGFTVFIGLIAAFISAVLLQGKEG